jgi:hypothetical protein
MWRARTSTKSPVYPVKGKEKRMTTPNCPGHRGNTATESTSDNTSVNAEGAKEKAFPTAVNADDGGEENAGRRSVEDPPEYT